MMQARHFSAWPFDVQQSLGGLQIEHDYLHCVYDKDLHNFDLISITNFLLHLEWFPSSAGQAAV